MHCRQILMAGLLAVVLAGMPLLNVEAAKMTDHDNAHKAVKVVQTAGRDQLGDFAPDFARYNDDILFGEV